MGLLTYTESLYRIHRQLAESYSKNYYVPPEIVTANSLIDAYITTWPESIYLIKNKNINPLDYVAKLTEWGFNKG